MLGKLFIRNISYNSLLEVFLVSGVSVILLLRFYLQLANYPQIGGNGLHIAHMLWGGMFMLLALLLLLFFYSSMLLRIAAGIAGIGFGLFIDEVGKFVTSDNNYFFQPSFAIIYVIFIMVYLFAKFIGRRKFSPTEYLVNSLELVKDIAIGDLDTEEKKKALMYLQQADLRNPLVKNTHDIFVKASINRTTQFWVIRLLNSITKVYDSIASKKWFPNLISAFFVIDALVSVVFALIFSLGVGFFFLKGILPKEVIPHILNVTFSDKVEFYSGLLSAILVVIGVTNLRKSRIKAYQFFKWSILVSIFITQVFSFYELQLAAIFGLIFDLLLLLTLNFMIEKERYTAISMTSLGKK